MAPKVSAIALPPSRGPGFPEGVSGDRHALGDAGWLQFTRERLANPQVFLPEAPEQPEDFLEAARLRHRRVTGVRNIAFDAGRHVEFVLGRPVVVRRMR